LLSTTSCSLLNRRYIIPTCLTHCVLSFLMYNMKLSFTLSLCILLFSHACVGADYFPTSITDLTSTHSTDQPISCLATQDQSGTKDNWEDYIEFDASATAYSGIIHFTYVSFSLHNFKEKKKKAKLFFSINIKFKFEVTMAISFCALPSFLHNFCLFSSSGCIPTIFDAMLFISRVLFFSLWTTTLFFLYSSHIGHCLSFLLICSYTSLHHLISYIGFHHKL
jgi:hypothetical protein